MNKIRCSISACVKESSTEVEAIATLIRDDHHHAWGVKPRPVRLWLCDGHLRSLVSADKLGT